MAFDAKCCALACSVLVLLMIMIGLALPIHTMKAGGIEAEYYIRDSKVTFQGSETTTNTWTMDCGNSDKCKEAISLRKAGFSFCFLGMLANLVVIVSLMKPNCHGPYPDIADKIPPPLGQKMPTVGLCGLLFVLYLIGMACALGATPKAASGSALEDELKVGPGGVLLILGWLLTLAVAGLSFMGLTDGGSEDAGDVEAPSPPPPAAAPPPPAAAPPPVAAPPPPAAEA